MPPKLGIIAGGGELPVRLASACLEQGREAFLLGLRGHADPADFPADLPQAWIRMGEVGKGFDILHRNKVVELVMAGPVRRPALSELRPDWRTVRFFAKLGMRALGDDGLLKALMAEIEAEGFHVVGAHSILGELLAEPGNWGRQAPDELARADIARGLEVAKGLGALDVGQSVVVQQGIVLGVEAVEGTDALLRRAGELRRDGPGGVLVKICKPGQDRRADLPTVGPETVRKAAAAGLRGIAVEAGSTIVLSREALIAEADTAKLFVCGIGL